MFRVLGYSFTTLLGIQAIQNGFSGKKLYDKFNNVQDNTRNGRLIKALGVYRTNFTAGFFTTIFSLKQLVNELKPATSKISNEDNNNNF